MCYNYKVRLIIYLDEHVHFSNQIVGITYDEVQDEIDNLLKYIYKCIDKLETIVKYL